MPELPEVENVKLSLMAVGAVGQVISDVELRRPNLRTALRASLRDQLPGQTLRAIDRRAKYLLFSLDDYVLLSHLGMSGSWRVDDGASQLHDHVRLHFRSGLSLVYHDPRRFGIFEAERNLHDHRWLEQLGLEPLSQAFTGERLFAMSRNRDTAIKVFIMDQKNVVGVGNIYASEALHRAGLRPTRAARRITRFEADRLVGEIKKILARAIVTGGSTIRDYRNSHGEEGAFQKEFLVYNREGEPCLSCAHPLRAKRIGGRNTFWCVRCQR